MNEKEKKEFYVANCKCCLLADTMKTCSVCHFNIGLAEKPQAVELQPFSLPIPVAMPAFHHQQSTIG